MELATLILEYLKALSWPAVVVFVAVLFRKPLKLLLNRIVTEAEEVSAYGVAAKFRSQTIEEQARQLQKESGAIDSGRLEARSPSPSSSSKSTNAEQQFLNKYLFAEELVMRVLEDRWSTPIQRQAAIELGGGRVIHADGLANTPSGLTLIEVKLLTNQLLPDAVLDSLCAQVETLERHLKVPVSAVLALATTLPSSEVAPVLEAARETASKRYASVRVEQFDIDSLVSTFLGVRRDVS